MKRKKWLQVEWNNAPDIGKKTLRLMKSLDLDWLDSKNIFFFRSENSKSRAYARIWGLSKIWQKALTTKPAYVIEVLSEKFDRLSLIEQDKVLLHELAHIPKNFSGSLLPHVRSRGKRNFHDRVNSLIASYLKKKSW